jgi:hypothetical protein
MPVTQGVRAGLVGTATMLPALALVFSGSALGFGPISGFGSFGSRAGQLDEPGNIAIDADGAA